MSDYGMLFQSIGFLIIIILLAYFALRYGLRSAYRGFGSGRMQVLERVVLDPKSGSALVLVQMGREVLLLGTSQGGVTLLRTLSEQDITELDKPDSGQALNLKESFSRVLCNLRKGSSADQDGDGSQ
jgi:flagellar biosynthetic protein FliO